MPCIRGQGEAGSSSAELLPAVWEDCEHPCPALVSDTLKLGSLQLWAPCASLGVCLRSVPQAPSPWAGAGMTDTTKERSWRTSFMKCKPPVSLIHCAQ